MAGGPSISGASSGFVSIGPALEQLRRDNALADAVHDSTEDEPHIVGIPKKFQAPAPAADVAEHGETVAP
jgi:hypothetical protein